MMVDVKHAPTPWYSKSYYVFDDNGYSVCDTISGKKSGKAEENAAHIVKCVNMHDELVETIKSLLNAGFFGSNGANDKALETLAKARGE